MFELRSLFPSGQLLAALATVFCALCVGVVRDVGPAQGGSPSVAALPGSDQYGTEDVHWRTRFSDTFVGVEGAHTTVFSASPLNYKDSAGAWQPIDTSLKATSNGFSNGANSFSLQLPAQLSDPVAVSSGGASVAFSLVGATGSASASGSTVSYTDALPAVDVRYDSLPQGLKESLVLKSSAAPSSFSFSMTPSAGLAAVVSGGGLQLKGSSGVAFDLSALFAVDAAGAKAPVGISLAGGKVVVAVDPAWLSDPKRVFPVVIDPTITPNPSLDCTLANGSSANTSFCASSTLDVGYDGTTTSRSVAKFDLSSLPSDALVDNAELKLYLASESTSASASISAFPLTRAFTSSATWNKYDGTNAWTTAGGDFASTPTVSSTAGGTLGWISWYPTTTVQQWSNGTLTNNGFLLKQTTEAGTTNVLHFSSNESSTNKPQLVVVWHYKVGDGRQYTMINQQIDDQMSMGVNVANGNLIVRSRDLQLPGIAGFDMTLGQTFNSMSGTTWFMGGHWQLTQAPFLFGYLYGDGSVKLLDPSGQELLFTPTTLVGSTQNYASATAVDATLTKDTTAGTWTLRYNQSGVKLAFDNGLVLTSVKDRNGNTITVNRSGGYVTGYTDTRGQTTSLTYNTGHTEITDVSYPSSRTVHYGYDSGGDLSSITDSNGKITQFTEDPGGSGSIGQITDPNGNVTTITYYGSGFYNAVHTVTRVTNTALGTGPTWTFTYNSGNTVVQDPNGKNWTYTYDKLDRVTQVTDPLGRNSSTDYTVYSGCPSGEQGSPGFDDSNGGGLTDDNGAVGNACFNSNNEPTRTLDPANANNRRALALATYNDTNNIYAPNTTTNANGNSWNYAYDTNGNLCAKSEGTATTQLTCAGGTGQGQNPVTFIRNSLGQVTSSTDGRGNATTYSYGATSHDLTGITYPTSTRSLGNPSFTYDTVHRLSTVTDGKGQTRTIGYDNLDRITSIQYKNSGGTVFDTIQFTYDDNGNLKTRVDAGGTTTYGYDPLNRLTSDAKPGGPTITYGYDSNSNLTSLVEPDGTTGYGYDDANRVTSITEPYANTGNGGKITYAYSLNSTTHELTTTITYPTLASVISVEDAAGRVESVTGKSSAGTVKSSFAYTYEYTSGTTNDGSLRRSMTWSLNGSSSETTNFSYDSLGRLTQANPLAGVNYQYCYDADGNLLAKAASCASPSYHYNANNEQTDTGYNNDANGNQTAIPADPTLAYNPEDQTSSITPSGGSATSQTYSGPGQKERTADGSTTFLYDALGLARRVSGTSTIYFTRAPDGTVLGERTTGGASGNYYYLFDGLGSVVALTNSPGGINSIYKYDPYGNITFETSGGQFNPIRYAGYYWNSTTSLYKTDARYYDPVMGRFTQRDPINQPLDTHGWNQYIYAGADPTNSVDPTGLIGCQTFFGSFECKLFGGTKTLVSRNKGLIFAGSLIGGAASACWRFGLLGARVAAVSFDPEAVALTGAVSCALAADASIQLKLYFQRH